MPDLTMRPRLAGASSLASLGLAVALGVDALVRGGLPGALVIMSALVATGSLLSGWASRHVQLAARFIWIAQAIACVTFSWIVFGPSDEEVKAADTVLLLAMLALSFPAGFIAVALVVLHSALIRDRHESWAELFAWWMAFAVVGYLQWFRLVPWFVERLRGRTGKAK